MKVNEQGRAVFETEGINQTWTNRYKSIKVNSSDIMDYYPSRIDLEFASDDKDNFYIVKNKGWSAYLDPTVLSSGFFDKEPINKKLLLSGYVPKLEYYNSYIVNYLLTEVNEKLTSPEYLAPDNYERNIILLMDTIDSLLKEVRTPETDFKLECLGSLYMLYKAKRKFFR